ncbi:hypothetical protein BDV36DRAFT_293758 [Aspergillus pseudocaelatus]|uniref:Uncharacterized protein n=1 Tax=Aspergillus pseudocaelatus TaxID=1825620 RepID=A0ABQ6WRY8_9EURO|nr:hypothetical protein BDV36DRAFT_293758 [Aspergillus pseudocaelatus]
MTNFKILFTFFAIFMFSFQTAMALPGNTKSVTSTAVDDYETGTQKSPAPAKDEPFASY